MLVYFKKFIKIQRNNIISSINIPNLCTLEILEKIKKLFSNISILKPISLKLHANKNTLLNLSNPYIFLSNNKLPNFEYLKSEYH